MTGSKPPLSVSFHNFWPEFEVRDSFFVKALSQNFTVTVEHAGRDVQFSGVFDHHRLPAVAGARPLRVWYGSETRDPQAQIFDLHFGFRPNTSLLSGRWFRYPLWIAYIDWWDATSSHHIGRLLEPQPWKPRSRFCNFIYSNDTAIRAEFFLRLNEARAVESSGRVLNNTGHFARGVDGKMAILADSTFTIAFENQFAPGYVTEKLLEPLLAGSIPIYWGAAEAKTDFNPDAFIFAEGFGSMDDLVAHVVQLADSPEALAALTSTPPLDGAAIPYEHTPEFFVDRIADALSGPPQPNAVTRWPAPWRPPPGPLKKLEMRIRQWRDRILKKW